MSHYISDIEVEQHPEYIRGMWLLRNRIDNYYDFESIWLQRGRFTDTVPTIEQINN